MLYLQQRAMTALQSQNQVIVRQLAEQTAADIAAELRRTLDGPIFDTLAAVNHPELRAGRLDLVAQHFTPRPRGLSRTSIASSRGFADGEPGAADARRRAVLRAQRRVRPRSRPRRTRCWIWPRRHAAHAADLRRRRGRRRRAPAGVPAPVLDRRPAPASTSPCSASSSSRPACASGCSPARAAAPSTTCCGGAAARCRSSCGSPTRPARSSTARCRADVDGARLTFPMLFYPADDIRTRLAAGVAPRPWAIDVGARAVRHRLRRRRASATGRRRCRCC